MTDSKDVIQGEPEPSFRSKLFSAVFKGVLAFLDLWVYISEQPIQIQFHDSDLQLSQTGIEFGAFDQSLTFEKNLNYTIPKLSGEPLFAHIYLSKSGHHPDPSVSKFDPKNTLYRRISLLKEMPRPVQTSNLISGEQKQPSVDSKEKVTYWYPEILISLVQDQSPLNPKALPPPMKRHFMFTLDRKSYLPIVYMNEFWQLKDKRIILEEGRSEYPLKISFNPMGMLKFQLLTNFDQSLQMNEQLFGGDGETEKLKQMFVDTNPYLLLVTLAVSLLHSIFDILAFKNDIQFWRQRDNLEGLSVRSVLINSAFQFIIFLYLMEQETSWLILASMAFGTCVEIWKITRVLSIRVRFSGMLPRVEIKDRATYAKSLTQHYDDLAMKYLGMVAVPLLIGYSIYSLVYQTHKSWYSWILGTMVGFVYTFGFITMTPQLFINYKLKSVAHMPWRVFVYKALNTFIDDLFAFIIKMPTLHRIACFRDDIVFVIYLYQRWIYPVDKTRANEYGQVFDSKKKMGEDENDNEDETESKDDNENKNEGKVAKSAKQKEHKPRKSLRSRTVKIVE